VDGLSPLVFWPILKVRSNRTVYTVFITKIPQYVAFTGFSNAQRRHKLTKLQATDHSCKRICTNGQADGENQL
jgi:hypothetical protein